MSTPDDVQRAAIQLAGLPNDPTSPGRLGMTLWNMMVELGWTPPGAGIDGRTAADLQAAHDAGYAEAQFQIEQAYTRGQCDAVSDPSTLTHRPPSPEDWTPVPLRWRHVRPGDVFVSDERAWMVLAAGKGEPGWLTSVVSGTDQYEAVEVDPDEVISVLCPVPEANALARVRDELGGTVVDRSV